MRRLNGYSWIGVLRLSGGDLALFEKIDREERSRSGLEPRGYFPTPPERIVMHNPPK
jgi:hypothetical protein